MPCDRPLPLPTCPDCTRPQRGRDAVCVCGYRFGATLSPMDLDPFTRALGLREVRKARKQLRVARALRQLDEQRVA